MPVHVEHEQFQQIGERLLNAMDANNTERVQEILNQDLSAVDIAHLIESTPSKRRADIWKFLSESQKGEVISHLGDDLQLHYLTKMSPEQVLETIQDLDSDDFADVLQQLPEPNRIAVLHSMEPEDRREVEVLLAYPEDTAGGLMNPEVLTIRANVTLDVVLRYLRRQSDLPDQFDSLYVVNRNDQLVGTLPLHALLLGDPDTTVREVMNSDIEGIPATSRDRDVAKLFANHDWISAPVVDEKGKLLGQITIDDIVDVIREEADHAVMSMAGLDEDEDAFAPVWSSAKGRAVWLGLNLLTAFIAALVILNFEDAIAMITALAVMNPVVASMGGVAGSQTLTLVIRAQATGKINTSNYLWLLGREFGVGLINGFLWAVITAFICWLLFSNVQLAIVSGIAILANITIAKISGALLPVILEKLKIDPALSGSVILTTVTDAVGFFTLLGLATWYLL
ncbi:magnesium transporter [Gynuella sp.]|uniref:magnesium transporter n=1 Tax=Gynuella sp. TaxID=2969146 RepID=UPI003D0A9870